MTSILAAKIVELEERTSRIAQLLRYAPRAFVIEFAGTPKSGKSTTVEAIRHFLSRHSFRVHVLSERAAMCPIPMKGHLFFNTWCATSMLAELLANVETETDIIIIDRGLFDALVWMTLQEKRGELTSDEARAIESFVLLERWRTLIDLVVVMTVSADEALRRENSQRITQKAGSIMNPDVLAAITGSVDEAAGRYGKHFRGIIPHQTTNKGPQEAGAELADRILDRLEEFLNPYLLVVPRVQVEKLPLKNGGSFDATSVGTVVKCIESSGTLVRRDEAERNEDYVQIVACGMLMYGDRVFVFQRKETDRKYRLYGKTTIWQGCHITKNGEKDVLKHLQGSLMERVSRSLFLSRSFPISPVGYCWDPQDLNSRQHLGVIFRIEIDNVNTATDLRKKEFRKRRGEGLSGEFVVLSNIDHGEQSPLESWSRSILEVVGKKP